MSAALWSRIEELRQSERPLVAISELRRMPEFDPGDAKALVFHIPRARGCCHRCGRTVGESIVICSHCRSLNVSAVSRSAAVSVAVIVNPAAMEVTGSGAVTGLLCLQIGDRRFPDDDWRDFPVVVLRWWIEESDRLLDGAPADLDFMDGPYHLRALPPSERNLCEIAFEERCVAGVVVHAEAVVDFGALQSSLFAAARRVLDGCHDHGWRNDDTRALGRLMRSRG